MECFLTLYFASNSSISLVETSFIRSDGSEYHCVRGRTGGAYSGYGTFLWSSAVIAMSELLLRHAANGADAPHGIARLVGGHGSSAASLDYALSKQPVWLSDLFGADKRGGLFASRVFLRTNSGQKRPGPVAIATNPRVLLPSNVEVILDQRSIMTTNELTELANEVSRIGLQPRAKISSNTNGYGNVMETHISLHS